MTSISSMHHSTQLPARQVLPGTCALVSWIYSNLLLQSHDQPNLTSSIVLFLWPPKLVRLNNAGEECLLKLYWTTLKNPSTIFFTLHTWPHCPQSTERLKWAIPSRAVKTWGIGEKERKITTINNKLHVEIYVRQNIYHVHVPVYLSYHVKLHVIDVAIEFNINCILTSLL